MVLPFVFKVLVVGAQMLAKSFAVGESSLAARYSAREEHHVDLSGVVWRGSNKFI